jgi:hypothetical protein
VELRELKEQRVWSVKAGNLAPRPWRNCLDAVVLGRKGILKDLKRVGTDANYTPKSTTADCPSA